MTPGLWFAVQSIISPVSGLLITTLKPDSGNVTTALLSNVALFLGYLTFGHLGRRYGRRRVLLISGISTTTIAVVTFLAMIMILESRGNFTLAMVLCTSSNPSPPRSAHPDTASPTASRWWPTSFSSVSMLGPSTVMAYIFIGAGSRANAATPELLV